MGVAKYIPLVAAIKAFMPQQPEVTSEKQLEKRAAEDAEKKRLAFGATKAEKGQTLFTSPVGMSGMNLKTQLGQ